MDNEPAIKYDALARYMVAAYISWRLNVGFDSAYDFTKGMKLDSSWVHFAASVDMLISKDKLSIVIPEKV
jgi:hypothetical protein